MNRFISCPGIELYFFRLAASSQASALRRFLFYVSPVGWAGSGDGDCLAFASQGDPLVRSLSGLCGALRMSEVAQSLRTGFF